MVTKKFSYANRKLTPKAENPNSITKKLMKSHRNRYPYTSAVLRDCRSNSWLKNDFTDSVYFWNECFTI